MISGREGATSLGFLRALFIPAALAVACLPFRAGDRAGRLSGVGGIAPLDRSLPDRRGPDGVKSCLASFLKHSEGLAPASTIVRRLLAFEVGVKSDRSQFGDARIDVGVEGVMGCLEASPGISGYWGDPDDSPSLLRALNISTGVVESTVTKSPGGLVDR